jgi:hypothetical protein
MLGPAGKRRQVTTVIARKSGAFMESDFRHLEFKLVEGYGWGFGVGNLGQQKQNLMGGTRI